MNVTETVIEGTLHVDGTLQLDRRPNLDPGRVTVVLRQQVDTGPVPQGNWFEHLRRIRAQREAEGYPFMQSAEVAAHVEWLREWDRVDELLRQADAPLGKP